MLWPVALTLFRVVSIHSEGEDLYLTMSFFHESTLSPFCCQLSLLLFANPCRPSSFEIVEVMSHRLHPWVLNICLYRPKLRLNIFQKHHFKGRITSISIHAHPIQAIKHSLFGSPKNVNFGCGGTMDIFLSRDIEGYPLDQVLRDFQWGPAGSIRNNPKWWLWVGLILWNYLSHTSVVNLLVATFWLVGSCRI